MSTFWPAADNNHRPMLMREVPQALATQVCTLLGACPHLQCCTEFEMDRSLHQTSLKMPTGSLLHQD